MTIVTNENEHNSNSPLLAEEARPNKSLTNKKLTCNLLLVGIIIAMNTLQFGYNIGALNIPQRVLTTCEDDHLYKKYFVFFRLLKCVRFNEFEFSLLTSLLPLGSLVGALICNYIMPNMGRKMLLIMNSLCLFFASFGSFLCDQVNLFLVYRFIGGACSGIALILVPVYLAEISPNNLKGTLGMLTSLSIVSGIILSQTIGVIYAVKSWRMVFFVQSFLSFINLLLLIKCPESFVYLLKKSTNSTHTSDKIHYYNKAERALRSIRSDNEDLKEELQISLTALQITDNSNQDNSIGISTSTQDKLSVGVVGTFDLFKSLVYLPSILFLMFVHMTQQFSGINAIMYYSTTIFEPAFGYESAQYISIAINVLQFIMNLVIVKVIERFGRKSLLMTSCVGMGISLGLLAIFIDLKYSNILTLLSMLLAIAFYAIALGPVPFILVADIFDKKATDAASTISITTNSTFNFVVAIIFPSLSKLVTWPNNNYDGNVFFVFGVYLIFAGLVVYKILPEPKNKDPFETMLSLRQNAKSFFITKQ